MREIPDSSNIRDWDPREMLNNLSFLEQKIHQLQDLVHLIIARRGQAASQSNEILVQQQQLITADLTSIIVQLISTAGSLLPSVKHTLSSVSPQVNQLGQFGESMMPSATGLDNSSRMLQSNANKVEDQSNEMDLEGVRKDPVVGRTNWDAFWLSDDQVEYASVDAFVSFLLGKTLKAWNWEESDDDDDDRGNYDNDDDDSYDD